MMARCKLSATDRKQLKIVFDAYDNARGELYDAIEEICLKWQDEFDEASERWQGSEPGNYAQGRIDSLCEIRDTFESPADFEIDDL